MADEYKDIIGVEALDSVIVAGGIKSKMTAFATDTNKLIHRFGSAYRKYQAEGYNTYYGRLSAGYTSSPLSREVLDINGALLLAGASDNSNAGTIKYDSGLFSFRDATKWINLFDGEYNSLLNKPSFAEFDGNGAVTGITMSINADITKFDIAAGTYRKIGTRDILTYAGQAGVTATHRTTSQLSYIAIDLSDMSIKQSASHFTNSERRTYLFLGVLQHPDLLTITGANSFPDVAVSALSQLHDLYDSLRQFNIEGNKFTPSGANLSINKTVGSMFKHGIGYAEPTGTTNPNTKDMAILTAPANIKHRMSNGVETANTAFVELFYEVVGTHTRTIIPTAKFTIHRIYLMGSNTVRIQLGQNIYNSLSESIAAIGTEVFVNDVTLSQNGLLRAFLIVKAGTTNLNTSTDALFVEADRWGQLPVNSSGESSLGNPSALGQVLTSTVEGIRSWSSELASKWGTVGTTNIYRNSKVKIGDANNPLAPLHITTTGAGINTGIRLDNSGTTGYTGFDFYNSTSPTVPIGQFFSCGSAYSSGVLTASAVGMFSELASNSLLLGTIGASAPVVVNAGGADLASTIAQFRKNGTYRGTYLQEQGGSPDILSGYHAIYPLSTDSMLKSKDDAGNEYLLSMWKEYTATSYYVNGYKDSASIFAAKAGSSFGFMQNAYVLGADIKAFKTGSYFSQIAQNEGRISFSSSSDSQTAGATVTNIAETLGIERRGGLSIPNASAAPSSGADKSSIYSADYNAVSTIHVQDESGTKSPICARGSFTMLLSGLNTTVNTTVKWQVSGKVVTLFIACAGLGGASTVPTVSLSGLPDFLRPTTAITGGGFTVASFAGVRQVIFPMIDTAGDIFHRDILGVFNNFPTGQFSYIDDITITYYLN